MKFFINRYRHKALKSVSFIGLISLVMLTACSSGGDTPGEEPNPTPTPEPPTVTAISFKSGLADEKEDITRSGGLESKVETFKVWAYKNMSVTDDKGTETTTDDEYGNDVQTVMPGYIVNWGANTALTTETNTNDWEYVGMGQDQTIKYWDWSAKAYRFFGVAETPTGPNNVTVAGGSPFSMTLTVDAHDNDGIAATPYFSHLWFSTGMILDYPDKLFAHPVILEFLKPIAQVRIKFTFVAGLGIDRTGLSQITFKPTANEYIPTKGTVTITYPLTGAEKKESFTSNPDYTSAINYISTDETWHNVLPRHSQGTYTLSVVVVGGDPKTAVVPAEYMTWSPGYHYTYIFKITETGGVTLDDIQVAINDWHLKESVEHPVYNW